MFSEFGNVNRLNLKKKDDGFTFAFISYDDVSEAERAVSKLNRRKIDNKFISVKFAKPQNGSRNDGPRRDDGDRKKFDKGNDRRGPMKCFKCQGEGHMSKNCTEDGQKKEEISYENISKELPPEDDY